MTYKNIYEEVHQIFPKVGINQVKLEMSRVLKDFLQKTRLLKANYDIVIDAGTVTYPLPADLISVYEVRFYDENGMEFKYPYSLKYEVNSDSITFLDTVGRQIKSVPCVIKKITLFYNSYMAAIDINNLNTEVPLPEEFQAAVTAGILASFYRRFPMLEIKDAGGNTTKTLDFSSMQAWKAEYKDYVISAKRLAAVNKDDTPYEL